LNSNQVELNLLKLRKYLTFYLKELNTWKTNMNSSEINNLISPYRADYVCSKTGKSFSVLLSNCLSLQGAKQEAKKKVPMGYHIIVSKGDRMLAISKYSDTKYSHAGSLNTCPYSWSKWTLMIVGIVIFLAGCTPSELPYKNFAYSDNERKVIAQCRLIFYEECGLTLQDCTDGRIRYCMTNIVNVEKK
jgi:hypothetical protein